jgi:repressor of nif and glnA expression
MPEKKNTTKEFEVDAKDIVDKVKEIIKEGNARKIIIKNEKGEQLLSIPVTVGAVGVLLAPVAAAVGAMAALMTKCTIVVEKKEE